MTSRRKLFGIRFPIFLLLMSAAVTLRFIALFNSFNFYTGYYTDKLLLNISAAIVLVGAVFFLAHTFLDREIKLVPSFTSAANYLPSALVGTALLFLAKPLITAAIALWKNIEELKLIATPSALASAKSLTTTFVIVLLTALFSVLAAVNFAVSALSSKHYSTKRALLALSTVLFFSFYVAFLYFNRDLPINAPNKIIDQISHLFAAVFFLYEARMAMGREKLKSYIAIGFISALTSAYSAIPALLCYATRGWISSNSIYEIALNLSVFIFVTVRLLQIEYLIEDKPSETVNALISAAEAREEAIAPKPQPEEEAEPEQSTDRMSDDNQITIDDVSQTPAEENAEEVETTEEI